MQIKYYSRYMDDCVLIHPDKQYLQDCLARLREYVKEELKLEFNEKTQVFPLRNGVDYLGWHIYLTDTGKVVRKVKQQTKYRYKRKLKYFEYAYANDLVSPEDVKQTLSSYRAHLSYCLKPRDKGGLGMREVLEYMGIPYENYLVEDSPRDRTD